MNFLLVMLVTSLITTRSYKDIQHEETETDCLFDLWTQAEHFCCVLDSRPIWSQKRGHRMGTLQ